MENNQEVKEEKKLSRKEKKELRKAQTKKFEKKVGSFFSDFKKFIAKGNILDLAVAVVIGAAFNKIVSSLVNNIIMPLISLATGGASVEDWKWVIKPATYDAAGNIVTAETALSYGIFIQSVIDFLIIAFTIFIILKIVVNSKRGVDTLAKRFIKKHKQEENEEEPQVVEPVKIESQEDILKDIRALLIQRQNQENTNLNENLNQNKEVIEEKENK